MTPSWRLRPHDPDKVLALSRGAGVHELLATLLLNRGLADPDRARSFLSARRDSMHDPELLPGCVEAADRITAAVRAGRKVIIYGDYDVDGVCGTTLLWSCLRLAGARALDFYIPHRVDEGYGVNAEALRTLVNDHGASLIVTVDCGISAVQEARLARGLGVELFITDHHHIGPDLPEADALVHPRLPGSRYPFGDLCGCGVAFKLAWQICKSVGDGKRASPQLRDFLLRSLNLVALATVADVVPLGDENRVFVRHGLRGLVDDGAAVGLKALLQVSGLLGKDRLTTGAIGFKLAPRINAAGRMAWARKAVDLLTTDDADVAFTIANELDECNRKRQEVERAIVDQAHAMVADGGGLGDRGAIVLGHRDWHPGVIGIVASRLVEYYHRPAIVVALAESIGQGSARSVPGFHLVEAISACSAGLIGFGGHAAAAGLKLTPDHFPAVAERFDLHCRAALTDDHKRRELVIDAEVPLGMLTPRLVDEIDGLEPYGIGNPRPLLAASGVRIVGEPRAMGDRKHYLSLRLAQGDVTFRSVDWSSPLAERGRKLAPATAYSVAFQPNINEWNGRREVQLELKDVRIDQEGRHALPA
jgi:single-stranded-DNA-specific exonuclease